MMTGNGDGVGMKECARAALDIVAILETLTGDEPQHVLDLVIKTGGFRSVQKSVQTRFKIGANAPGANGANEPVHEPVQIGANAPILTKRFCSSSFLVFWSVYPRKIGKQEASRIWNRLKPDQVLVDRILQAVREQKTSVEWTRENGQFIPHPKTWLNQGRWDDEPVQMNQMYQGAESVQMNQEHQSAESVQMHQVHQGSLLSDRTRGNAHVARSFVEHLKHDRP
jgi:hypothetical protein